MTEAESAARQHTLTLSAAHLCALRNVARIALRDLDNKEDGIEYVARHLAEMVLATLGDLANLPEPEHDFPF